MKNNNILVIQFCYVKLKTLESDIDTWEVDALRDADKAEVKALVDRIRRLKNDLDNLSTLQLIKLSKKEIKELDNRCFTLIQEWKELRYIIETIGTSTYSAYFKALKIKPTTDFNDIKKAYKKRAQETHPDHKGGSEKEFMKVKDAYDNLKAAYDK